MALLAGRVLSKRLSSRLGSSSLAPTLVGSLAGIKAVSARSFSQSSALRKDPDSKNDPKKDFRALTPGEVRQLQLSTRKLLKELGVVEEEQNRHQKHLETFAMDQALGQQSHLHTSATQQDVYKKQQDPEIGNVGRKKHSPNKKKAKSKTEKVETQKEREVVQEARTEERSEEKQQDYRWDRVFAAATTVAGFFGFGYLYRNYTSISKTRPSSPKSKRDETTPYGSSGGKKNEKAGTPPPGDRGLESLQNKRTDHSRQSEPIFSRSYGSGDETVFTNNGVSTSRSARDNSLILNLLGMEGEEGTVSGHTSSEDLIINRESEKTDFERRFEAKLPELNRQQLAKERAERHSQA